MELLTGLKMQKWRKEQWDQYFLEKQERNSIQNRNEVMRHPNTGSSSSANTQRSVGAPVSASENRLRFPIFSDSEDNISEDIETHARKRKKYDAIHTKNYENHAERKAPDEHDRMRIPRTLKAENSRSQNPITIDEILDSFPYYRSLNSKMMSSNSNVTSQHPFPKARQSTSYRNSSPSSSLCAVSDRRTNIPPKTQQSSTSYINKPSTYHENLKNDERRRENNTKNCKNHAEQQSLDKSSKIKTETTSKVTQISKTTQGFNNDKRSNNFPNQQHTSTTTTNKNMPSTSYDTSKREERKKEFDTTNFKNHTERHTSDQSSKIRTETSRVTQIPNVHKKAQETNNAGNMDTDTPSTSNETSKKDEKKRKLNTENLEAIKKLFVNTLKETSTKILLNERDIVLLNGFLEMDIKRQYFIIELFISRSPLYKLGNFCEILSETDIDEMYKDPKMRIYFDTDMHKLDIKDLLRILAAKPYEGVNCLKNIKKKFHLPTETEKKKEVHMNDLLNKIENASELKNAVIEKLGDRVKLNDETKVAFGKAYILQAYCNPAYQRDIYNYLADSIGRGVVYPEYIIENFTLFETEERFSLFFHAFYMKQNLYSALQENDLNVCMNICREAIEWLENCNGSSPGKWDRELSTYLHKYSAEYQYISILSNCIGNKNLKIADDDLERWLKHLIQNYPTNHDVALWYKHLAQLMMRCEEYKNAAEYSKKLYDIRNKTYIDSFPITELSNLANKIEKKAPRLYCKLLAPLSGLKKKKITQEIVLWEKSSTRKNKKNDGEDIEGEMKTIALKHYASKNCKGISCGGEFIEAVFALLFWDIIYGFYVANTFISNLQNAPLDMYSDSFYENRKENIDKRLDEIATHWSSEKLEQTLKNNWKKHSHEKSIVDFNILENVIDDVLNNFCCVDRIVLSKILGRLIINLKRFRGGFPDLFLWNTEEKKCKFVKVKYEKDQLSSDEFLWIQYLKDIRADVEKCCISVTVPVNGENKKNTSPNIKGTSTVLSLQSMKYNSFDGSIHTISIDPFFVHYWLPEQIAVYMDYHDEVFFKKIQLLGGDLCPHIYLYLAVTETPTDKMPIFQMLSAIQNTNTIHYWLSEFLRVGEKRRSNFPVPRTVVCDFDKSLLNAICKAFTQCKNLKNYLSICHALLLNKRGLELPKTFLRLDISHYMNFISQWQCLTKAQPRVKKFYLRAMAVLTKQTDFIEFQDMMKHILVLCCSDGFGKNKNGESVAAQQSYEYIDENIKGNENFLARINKNETEDHNHQDEDFPSRLDDVDDDILIWTENIFTECEKIVELCGDGDQINPYYIPEMKQKLKNLVQYYPVFSGVMISLFGYGEPYISTASVKDLKHVLLKNDSQPMRADKFVCTHLLSFRDRSKLNLADSNFTADVIAVSSEKEDLSTILEMPPKVSVPKRHISEKEEKHNSEYDESMIPSAEHIRQNKNPPVKRRRIDLDPCPTIDSSNFQRKFGIENLQNGLRCQEITCGGKNIALSNTCGFDSIISLLAGACTNEKFKEYVNRSNTDTMMFLRDFINYGCCDETYIKRAHLLMKHFRLKDVNGVMRVDCLSNIGNMAQYILVDDPSYIEIKMCYICSKRTHRQSVIVPIHEDIIKTSGFKSLKEAIIQGMPIFGTRCCDNLMARSLKYGPLIVIEYDEPSTSFKTTLSEFPHRLVLNSKIFILAGIVARTGSSEMGHYVGYSYQGSTWIEFDDLKENTRKIENSFQIEPHLVIYVATE